MTGFTADLHRFNVWFNCNYSVLQKYCKRYRIPEDTINDVYISTHDRITRSGFTESYFTTYVKRSMRNLRINEAKKVNGRHMIDFNDLDYLNTIEVKLQETDEIEKDTLQYREDVMLFSKMMFKYIQERQYNEEWQFIFRCYYLMPNRFTYAKLHTMTGYNKNHCTRVIQTMKKDIRDNFLNWFKDGQRGNN